MKNKDLITFLGLAAGALFFSNKTFAQAERKVMSFDHVKDVHESAVLPKNVKLVSGRSLDAASPGMDAMCQCATVSMVNDTVIVQTDRAVQMINDEPEMRKQINKVRNMTKDVPKNSVIEFTASAESDGLTEVEVAIYTQQNTDTTAYFHGTPAENLKKMHYNMGLFKMEIQANNYEKHPGKVNYSREEAFAVTERAKNEWKWPGSNYKYEQ